MAYSLDYLKENMRVKCEFLMRDGEGQNISRVCTLGELDDLSSYERNNIVGLVLFPMRKSGTKSQFADIDNALESIIRDLPNLRNLAITSQFSKMNVAKIKKNGCPSLARCITIKSSSDKELRDITLGDKKTIHNKSFKDRETDNNYFCQLIDGGDDTCEIIDVYDSYEFPKEEKVVAKDTDNQSQSDSATNALIVFENKKNEIEETLKDDEYVEDVDYSKYDEALKNMVYGLPIEKRLILKNQIERINPNISREALKDAIPNLFEDMPKLFAAPESIKEELIEELVRKVQKIDATNGNLEEVSEEFEEDLVRIMLSDDQLFYSYHVEKLLQDDKMVLIEKIRSKIQQSAVNLGPDINKCYKRMGLTGEVAAKITNLIGAYVSNNGKRIENKVYEVLTKMPSVNNINAIVDKALEDKNIELSEEQLNEIKEGVASAVVEKMGDISKLSDDDLFNIASIVTSRLSTLDIDYLHKSVAEIKKSLNDIVSKKDIEDGFKSIEKEMSTLKDDLELGFGIVDEELDNQSIQLQSISERVDAANMGMLEIEEKVNDIDKNVGLVDEKVGDIDKKLDDINNKTISLEEKIDTVFKFIKENNLTKEQVEQLMSSKFGTMLNSIVQENNASQTSIINALNNLQKSITNNTKQNATNTQNNIINQLNNVINNINNNTNTQVAGIQNNTINFQNVCQNLVQGFVLYNTIAQNMVNNYQMTMGGVPGLGIVNNVVNPVNPMMNAAITNVLMLSMLGLGVNQNMGNLNYVQNNANNTQQIINLINAIQQVINMNNNGGQQKPTPKDNNNDKDNNDQKDNNNNNGNDNKNDKKNTGTDKKNTGDNNTKPVQYKKVQPPKKTKQFEFKDKSIENLDKLYEPKKKPSILKSFARKPLKAVLATAGIGLLAGTGLFLAGNIATIASGIGFGAIVSALSTGTITAAVTGAAVGGISGGVLRSIASAFNFVRRERLYQKFQSKYKKAINAKEKVEIDKVKVAIKENEKEELRAKLRSAKNEKQRNKALKAIAKKRNALNRTKNQKDRHEKTYSARVSNALNTKEKLNNLEDKTGKTTALAGTLQYLRKKQSKVDDAEYEDIKKSISEELSDIFGKKVDVNEMSTKHKTYDREASDLIESIEEMKRSNEMKSILNDIKKRHSKPVEQSVVIDQYDANDIIKLQEEVKKNPTDENMAMFKAVTEDYKKIQEEIDKHQSR